MLGDLAAREGRAWRCRAGRNLDLGVDLAAARIPRSLYVTAGLARPRWQAGLISSARSKCRSATKFPQGMGDHTEHVVHVCAAVLPRGPSAAFARLSRTPAWRNARVRSTRSCFTRSFIGPTLLGFWGGDSLHRPWLRHPPAEAMWSAPLRMSKRPPLREVADVSGERRIRSHRRETAGEAEAPSRRLPIRTIPSRPSRSDGRRGGLRVGAAGSRPSRRPRSSAKELRGRCRLRPRLRLRRLPPLEPDRSRRMAQPRSGSSCSSASASSPRHREGPAALPALALTSGDLDGSGTASVSVVERKSRAPSMPVRPRRSFVRRRCGACRR